MTRSMSRERDSVVTLIFDADVRVGLSERLDVGQIRRADDDHFQRHAAADGTTYVSLTH